VEAYLYFLPGYMLASLENWDQASSLVESIISIGGYPDETEAVLKERENDCQTLFTESQRTAIAAFLADLSREWTWEKESIEFAIRRILDVPQK
jgi:hypothetical protein